ncbi:hypothetical protein L207DRAFT_517020 [Hyaloscypha variabilis F]|uniref:Uncharacterized protein n=1 Tax=Hyaloscypha variabilis (strain UAMH 11265 / GT02V1 / F) TaxID=1149755 RepID=A0A2J6R8M8_HYAVF|nr:hypothetical protein L207DRAFT_517020 [Hyaloscypha variabilis F]
MLSFCEDDEKLRTKLKWKGLEHGTDWQHQHRHQATTSRDQHEHTFNLFSKHHRSGFNKSFHDSQ